MIKVTAFIGNIGVPEMVVVLALALLIFGPAKLPGVGKAIGQSIRDFRNAMNSREEKEEADNINEELNQK